MNDATPNPAHFRQSGPIITPSTAPAWKCVNCGWEETERFLICPNCATDGALAAEDALPPAPCTYNGCGRLWNDPVHGYRANGHMFRPAPSTEEQPPAADATVVTEANCMRRGDQHHPHAWLLNGHSYHCDGTPAAT